MIDTWIVFGGWGTDPRLLAPIFGSNAVYIDINPLMPFLVRDGVVIDDWRQRLCGIVTEKIVVPEKPFGIAGWSTGAMLAWPFASRHIPSAGVFISATPSFCRRREAGFFHGQRRSIIQTMRERLATDPESVTAKFREQCGIPVVSSGENAPVRSDQLIAGLHFLEQATLLPIEKPSCPALFLHGKTDSVIPVSAGRFFCAAANGTMVELDGPHAFFINNPEETFSIIGDFTER